MLLWIVGPLAAVVVVVVGIGALLPVRHTATVERVIAASPDTVYARVSHPEDFPSWRSGITRVEVLTVPGGPVRYREVAGRDAITYEVELAEPAVRYRTRIADSGLPFGGAWTWELASDPAGTRVRVTEDGEVYNPLFRFVSRFMMGHTATMERYLADLSTAVARPR